MRLSCTVLAFPLALMLSSRLTAAGEISPRSVVVPGEASPLETLAAREVVRYVYLRTGTRLPIVTADAPPPDAAVVIARKDRPLARTCGGPTAKDALGTLGPDAYLLRTCEPPGRSPLLLLTGGNDAGTLYAAYRLAEHLGVRFSLAGETVPDDRVPFALPRLDERAAPLFSVRGLQPFHDFYEGPDWWNAAEYKLYLSQMAKLRMNFLGLHCYPDFGAGPELSVWIGPPDEIGQGTQVRHSYPAFYANTLRAGWGMAPMKTGAYTAGAAMLFEQDGFGPDVMLGRCPLPDTPDDCNSAFDDAARTLRDAFTHAHALGIQTCVGTETPLTIPRAVRERLKAAGKDPADPAVIRTVYEGMFRRIQQSYPIDYYWLWTDEGWTWKTPEPKRIEAVTRDLRLAQEALANVKAPFPLATCGWVLGPPGDRQGFDRLLAPASPMSCINRQVGHAPVEPAFARIHGRPLWAIPWLENDPNLTAPQLWVGRMRQDAADARRYGCTGLLGIHWRTAVLGPNIEALARAAWSQPWPAAAAAAANRPPDDGAAGGQAASYLQSRIRGAGADEPLYQTVRYGMDGYHLAVPNGVYTVTLKMVELAYDKPGVRVFDAAVQGRPLFEKGVTGRPLLCNTLKTKDLQLFA